MGYITATCCTGVSWKKKSWTHQLLNCIKPKSPTKGLWVLDHGVGSHSWWFGMVAFKSHTMMFLLGKSLHYQVELYPSQISMNGKLPISEIFILLLLMGIYVFLTIFVDCLLMLKKYSDMGTLYLPALSATWPPRPTIQHFFSAGGKFSMGKL